MGIRETLSSLRPAGEIVSFDMPGIPQPVLIKRLSLSEMMALPDKATATDVALASLVDENGARLFITDDELRKLTHVVALAVIKAANEVNTSDIEQLVKK